MSFFNVTYLAREGFHSKKRGKKVFLMVFDLELMVDNNLGDWQSRAHTEFINIP